MKRLENKIVFITGGNSGIGKASALEAARESATIVIADLATKDHSETMAEIIALGVKCMFVPIEVSDVESVKKAITATVSEFGRLDIAFNNAGIGGTYSGIHDLSEATWERLIAVNLTGQFYCVKYELQQFLKQGGGVIVNMSSLAGLKAEHGLVPYTVAKHGVMGITQNIAVQYAPAEVHTAWIEGTPMKRLCTPEEVAKAFIFLASNDSSYCNSTQLILDVGVMA